MATMTARDELEVLRATWCDMSAHLDTLVGLVRETAIRREQPPRCAELGVRGGASTTALLAALEQTGGTLWSVDREQHTCPLHGHPQWTFYRGDSTSADTAARCPRDLDVLFIDTSHEHEATMRELELFGPLVRRGGIIAMHDAELPGVTVPAVAFALQHGYLVTINPGDHGLLIIDTE